MWCRNITICKYVVICHWIVHELFDINKDINSVCFCYTLHYSTTCQRSRCSKCILSIRNPITYEVLWKNCWERIFKHHISIHRFFDIMISHSLSLLLLVCAPAFSNAGKVKAYKNVPIPKNGTSCTAQVTFSITVRFKSNEIMNTIVCVFCEDYLYCWLTNIFIIRLPE